MSDVFLNNFVIGGIAREVTIFTIGDSALVNAETGPVNLSAIVSGLFVPQSWPMVCVTSTITKPAAADISSAQAPSYTVLPKSILITIKDTINIVFVINRDINTEVFFSWSDSSLRAPADRRCTNRSRLSPFTIEKAVSAADSPNTKINTINNSTE